RGGTERRQRQPSAQLDHLFHALSLSTFCFCFPAAHGRTDDRVDQNGRHVTFGRAARNPKEDPERRILRSTATRTPPFMNTARRAGKPPIPTNPPDLASASDISTLERPLEPGAPQTFTPIDELRARWPA